MQPLPSESPPLYVVLNARSGHDDAQSARATIERLLAEAGRHHELLVADRPGRLPQAIERAAELAQRHGGALVAAGGDGTLAGVAQAALHRSLPMGVLPQGTFNYFGRTHGIPQEIEASLQALLAARVEPVQVGRVRSAAPGADPAGRAFLVNASLGLYPQLLEDREAWKRACGRSRVVAAWSALVTVCTAHRPLRLQLNAGDGTPRTVRTPTLFVGNNALQLDRIGLPGVAALEQGRLVAVTLAPVGTFRLLGLMLRGVFGQLGQSDSVVSFGFDQLAVRPARRLSSRRVKLAADGEVFWLRAPLVFDVWPQPLQLLKPPAPQAVR